MQAEPIRLGQAIEEWVTAYFRAADDQELADARIALAHDIGMLRRAVDAEMARRRIERRRPWSDGLAA